MKKDQIFVIYIILFLVELKENDEIFILLGKKKLNLN